MGRYLLLITLSLSIYGCQYHRAAQPLYATVTASEVTRVRQKPARRAAIVANLSPGTPVQVLKRNGGQWLEARTNTGIIGWIESRDLLARWDYQEWQLLAGQVNGRNRQSRAFTAEAANLRLRPGRQAVKVARLNRGVELDLFALAHLLEPRPETWYLVRTDDGLTGWLYSRLAIIPLPDEVARYAENRTIIAWHRLPGTDEHHPNLLIIEREEGSDIDFDRLRVLYWNRQRQRYELAWRLKNLTGLLPLDVTINSRTRTTTFRFQRLDSAPSTSIITNAYQLSGTQVVSTTPSVRN